MSNQHYRIFGNGQRVTANEAQAIVQASTYRKNENGRLILDPLEAARALARLLMTEPNYLQFQGTEPRKGTWRWWNKTWHVYNTAKLEGDIEWIFEGLVSAKAVKDMVELLAIKLHLPHEEWDVPKIVAFNNGVWEIGEKKVQVYEPGFRPEDYITVNVPITLPTKSAEHPLWDQFLEKSLPNRMDRMTLAEMMGCIFFPSYNPQAFFTLVGQPDSGKSTIGRVLEVMLGTERVNSTATCRLGKTFEAHALRGKLVNIDAEASFMTAEGEQILKAITGGDTINVRPLYRDSFPVRLPTKMVMISNDLPPFTDKTDALWDRLVVLPFLHSIPAKDRITDLEQELEPEFGAIVVWALKGFNRVLRKGTRNQAFTQSTAALGFAKQHRKNSNPALAFFTDYCVMEEGAKVEKAEVYAAFVQYCRENGHTKNYTAANAGKVFMNIEGVDDTRTHDNRYWYTGFKLLTP